MELVTHRSNNFSCRLEPAALPNLLAGFAQKARQAVAQALSKSGTMLQS